MAGPAEHVTGASHRGNKGIAYRRWPALLGLNAVFAVTMVDGTILYPALKAIRIDLGITASDTSWLVAAYLLSFGALLPFCHRLTERIGPRRALGWGVVLLAISSALATAAWSIGALLLARTLQGTAAAFISTAAVSLLQAALHGQPSDRRLLRVWAVIGALGGTIGLVLGGAIAAYLNWRWIFAGYLVVAAGVLALVHKLPTLENPVKRADPPMAPRLLRRRGAIGGVAVLLLVGASFDGSLYLLVLYGQEVLGYSPLALALSLTVLTLASVAGSALAQPASIWWGLRLAAFVGIVLISAGALVLFTISVPGSFADDVLAGVLLVGFGIGAAFVAAQITIMLEAGRTPAVAEDGLADTAFALGGAAGLIVLSRLVAGLDLDSGTAGGVTALAELTAKLRTGFGVVAAVAACTVAAVVLFPRRSTRPPDSGV